MLTKELKGSGHRAFLWHQMGNPELLLIRQRSPSAMILQMLFHSQGEHLAFPNGTGNVSGWMGGFPDHLYYHGSPLSYLFEACV